MNINDKEFGDKLKVLGDLYEEGKDCLNDFSTDFESPGLPPTYFRLFEILKEMRDIAALQMKSFHTTEEN